MNTKLRAIIIEDEQPARELLKAYLNEFKDIELVAECEDGFTGVKAVAEYHPDLILLDIQMPKLSGFEMLELLDEVPEIIFTTAFDEFALKAFEMNAVDYLMKPFSQERFSKAIEKVYQRLSNRQPARDNVKKMVEQVKDAKETLSRLFVKTGNHIDVIPVEEIIRIEAQDDYVDIFTSKGKYLKKETMSYLENHLPADTFMRVHRSQIVNLNRIEKIEKYGKESYLLILDEGSKVKVSKNRIKELKGQLGI